MEAPSLVVLPAAFCVACCWRVKIMKRAIRLGLSRRAAWGAEWGKGSAPGRSKLLIRRSRRADCLYSLRYRVHVHMQTRICSPPPAVGQAYATGIVPVPRS